MNGDLVMAFQPPTVAIEDFALDLILDEARKLVNALDKTRELEVPYEVSDKLEDNYAKAKTLVERLEHEIAWAKR